MSDFIPGEAYRLDIVGADESVLVDSWTSQIKASVVARDGTLQVDVDTGRIYGPLVGDIQDIDGSVIFNSVTKTLSASVIGSVFDENGSPIVDTTTGVVNASLNGSVFDSYGSIIVNSANRTIEANSIYGTFYGDLIGNVTSSNTMFGTFSGDFNGSHYGEFYGDMIGDVTGSLNGNVVGDVVGNITGNLKGNIIANNDLQLTSYSESLDQWNWQGGVAHPNPQGIGPIIILGENRTDSHLKGHIKHYNGSNVVLLQNDNVADFFGRFNGNLYSPDGFPLINKNNDSLSITDNKIIIQANDTGTVIIKAKNYFKHFAVSDNDPKEIIMTYKGNNDNKQALVPGDIVYHQSVEAFDGVGFKELGNYTFGVDPGKTHSTSNNYMPGMFVLSLSNGVNNPNESNAANYFTFNGDGVLVAPVINLGAKTFSQRDSMTPKEGMIIFNTSNKKFQGYTGSGWVDLH